MKNATINQIKEGLLRGFSASEIKKELLKKGVDIKEIDDSIKEVYKTHVHNLKEYIKNEVGLGYKLKDIKQYLISVGHSEDHINLAIKELEEKTLGQKIVEGEKALKKKTAEETKLLREEIEKELNEVKESLKSKEEKIKRGFENLEPWKRGAFIGFSIITIISIITEIFMIIAVHTETGAFNCFSPYRAVSCTTMEGIGYYLLIFAAFTVVFAIPAAVIGALINHFIWRK